MTFMPVRWRRRRTPAPPGGLAVAERRAARRVVSMCGHLGHDPDMLGRCRDCGAVDCQGAAT